MAKNIVISGETLAGKTMVALAVSSQLRSQGMKVGYFKPVGTKSYEHSTPDQDVDEDAAIMKDMLEMEQDIGVICPIIQTQATFDEFIRVGKDALVERMKKSYQDISEDKDYVIIEGMRAPWNLSHIGLSTATIAKEFEASVICLVNFSDITAIDDIIMMKDYFSQHGVNQFSIILNMVPPMLKKTIKNEIQPFLTELGIPLCGVIYHRRELFSPSVREILRAIDGQIVTGEEKLDVLIDHFLIGSMAPENALKWFRRAKDKAVITSGDRADICLAALETDTNLLILTGGMGPDIRTIARAKELDVPIMMTAHDTYTTGHIVDNLIGTVTPENKEKIAMVDKIVSQAIDIDCIMKPE
ncbi:MAG: DRTGG domain-containing protein [Candidatus Thorarchaeota archaeon]